MHAINQLPAKWEAYADGIEEEFAEHELAANCLKKAAEELRKAIGKPYPRHCCDCNKHTVMPVGQCDQCGELYYGNEREDARMVIQLRQEIESAAKICDPRDFEKFANLVTMIDESIGVTVRLHAEAADGNSPDVVEWIDGTMEDANAVAHFSPEDAAKWWHRKYASV